VNLYVVLRSDSVLLTVFTDAVILSVLNAIEPEKVYALPDHSLPDDDFKLMTTLSDLADRELVATISWAKQVPGIFCYENTDFLLCSVCVVYVKFFLCL
jgi:hypothetical protein